MLKGLGKFIFEEDDAPEAVAPKAVSAPTATPHLDTIATRPKGVEYTKILVDALENKAEKATGFDYYKFKKSVTAMGSSGDEKADFVKAYAVLHTCGAEKTKIISTADDYLKVLDGEREEFEGGLKASMEDIECVSAKAKEADAAIASRREQLAKLTLDIESLTKSRAAMLDQAEADKARIQTKGTAFISAYDDLVLEIKKDIEKITRYL